MDIDVSAGGNRISPNLHFGGGLGPTMCSYPAYFYLNFPMLYLANSTNTALTNDRRTTTTKGEIVKFFCMQLAKCLQPIKGGIKSLFKADNIDEKTIYSGGNYGERFGSITENRYRNILFFLRLKGPKPAGIGVDPWWEVIDFVNTFNIN
jgi:hypothetical protein